MTHSFFAVIRKIYLRWREGKAHSALRLRIKAHTGGFTHKNNNGCLKKLDSHFLSLLPEGLYNLGAQKHLISQFLDVDIQNLELQHASRNCNLYNLALLLAQNSLGDRCTDSELTLTQVSLVL